MGGGAAFGVAAGAGAFGAVPPTGFADAIGGRDFAVPPTGLADEIGGSAFFGGAGLSGVSDDPDFTSFSSDIDLPLWNTAHSISLDDDVVW